MMWTWNYGSNMNYFEADVIYVMLQCGLVDAEMLVLCGVGAAALGHAIVPVLVHAAWAMLRWACVLRLILWRLACVLLEAVAAGYGGPCFL